MCGPALNLVKQQKGNQMKRKPKQHHFRVTFCYHLQLQTGEGNGNPLQYSCLEN